MTLTAAERLKVADEALRLCKAAGKIENFEQRISSQAKAILKLAEIQRADMAVFRDAIGMTPDDFRVCLNMARQSRSSVLFLSKNNSPVAKSIMLQIIEEVAK